MGSAALKPSAAVSQLLRNRRKELNLTLREVSERIAEYGERFPTSTLVRIEQGKLDPGIRRLHLLLRLYEIPPHLVADLVELEELAVDEPKSKDLNALYSEGIEFWRKGDIGQALAYLFAIRQYVPDDDNTRLLRQKATLGFAVAARDLGKLKLARQLVEDLLCEPPDSSMLVQLLVTASTIWRGLGSLEMALASIRQAELHLDPADRQQSAWVLHQEAKLLFESGKLEEAATVLESALKRYRSLKDTEGEARGLTVRVRLLEAQGDLDGALECARQAIALAERCGHELSMISNRMVLGRLLVKSGDPAAGLDQLHKALSQAVLKGDRIAEFHAHYHLWKAHEALGDRDRMRFEQKAASYFVKFIDSHSPEAEEVRRILAKEETGVRSLVTAPVL